MKKKRRFFRLMPLFLLALGTCAIVVALAYFQLPDVLVLKNRYPVVRHRPGKRPAVELAVKRPVSWVRLGDISREAVGAVIVSEDWAFFQHHGVDLRQIKNAVQTDWKARRFVRGASTITQQVARNVFLEKDKNLWRKLKELFLALALEKNFKKTAILEIYFNIAEWGEGIYGIGEAAAYYFKKHPSDLSAKEGAFLAMLLPSPGKYNLSFEQGELTPYAVETIESILRKMIQAGVLTREEGETAMHIPLSFERTAEELQPSETLTAP